ncbi:MAG: alpha-galactosidase [Chloroflexota bacterium]
MDDLYLGTDLILHARDHSLDFVFQGKPVVSGITAGLSFRVDDNAQRLVLGQVTTSYQLGKKELVVQNEDGELVLRWHVELKDPLIFWLEAKNRGAKTVQIDQLGPLIVEGAPESALGLRGQITGWSFYQNGWQSWSPVFVRHLGDGLYVESGSADYRSKHLPHGPLGEGFASEWFTVIASNEGGPALLAGFVSMADQLAEIRLGVDPQSNSLNLQALCHADGVKLAPGETMQSERLAVKAGKSPHALLESYAGLVQGIMDARAVCQVPTGWCTWYYYYGENTAEDVLANMERIKQLKLPLECILVDDGYQADVGDWLEPNEKHPRGMKWLADQIVARGFKPGIWLAPFSVTATSHLYAAHPDWIIRNPQGEPVLALQNWGTDVYGLDCTNPEVQAWLGELFRVMSQEWGYQFFKIDFVYSAALEGVRFDVQATRAQAFRRGLRTIREAIGDRFLLGCGAPLGPSVGLMDGMRIGPDVAVNWHPFWQDLTMPSAENAGRNAIARYFLHGKLWANDPDCLVARRRDDQSDLTLGQVRTIATIIGLSGGMVLASDNFPTLAACRQRVLQQLLPPLGQAAVPMDLFRNESPELLLLPIATDFGEWLIVASINWTDRTRKTTLRVNELMGQRVSEGISHDVPHPTLYHAFDFWSERYLGIVGEKLVLHNHLPHSPKVILLKPTSPEPELLASTFHISQGGREVKWLTRSPGKLTLEMEKPGSQFGRLYFTVPSPYRVTGCRLNGRRRPWQSVAGGVVVLGFRLQGSAVIEIEWERRS